MFSCQSVGVNGVKKFLMLSHVRIHFLVLKRFTFHFRSEYLQSPSSHLPSFALSEGCPQASVEPSATHIALVYHFFGMLQHACIPFSNLCGRLGQGAGRPPRPSRRGGAGVADPIPWFRNLNGSASACSRSRWGLALLIVHRVVACQGAMHGRYELSRRYHDIRGMLGTDLPEPDCPM